MKIEFRYLIDTDMNYKTACISIDDRPFTWVTDIIDLVMKAIIEMQNECNCTEYAQIDRETYNGAIHHTIYAVFSDDNAKDIFHKKLSDLAWSF